MLWIPLFLLGLTQLAPSQGQFVYAYDAESNGPPDSDLFNPSSFQYVPPSEIQKESGTNYVGRASTVSGRVDRSRAASSRPQQSIATRTFATASEYFHPTRGDNEEARAQQRYQAPAQQEYQDPAPQPAPRRTYQPAPRRTNQPAPQRTYQPAPRRTYQPAPQRTYQPAPQRAYQPPPPPPRETYRPPVQEYVPQPAPQHHLVHQADQFEISRQQLYADQPRHSTPYQYVATYPQTHQASSPFRSYQTFHQTPAQTEAPRVVYRQVEHQPLTNFRYESPIYSNSPDANPGPAQESFFRTAGGRPFVPQAQTEYRVTEPYQYHYRPTEFQAPVQEYQELTPEQPLEELAQPLPDYNQIEEAPRPAPTRAPPRKRTRPVAYEPATTKRPRSRPQPAPREEAYVAPRTERRPQRRPASTTTDESDRTRPASIGVARLPADSDGDGIPGRGGVDYPTLSEVPKTSFSCARQPINGYYADLETSCQVVHSCQAGGIQHSFLCPNGTVFNQEKFSCQWWYRVDCSQASQYYALNEKLYKTTEAPRRRAQPPPPPARAPEPQQQQPPPRRAPQPPRRAPPPPQPQEEVVYEQAPPPPTRELSRAQKRRPQPQEEVVYEQPSAPPTRGPSRAQKRRQRLRAKAEAEAVQAALARGG